MKRTIVVLLVLLLLAGCSSTEEPSMVTRACSLEDSGMTLIIEAEAQSEEADVETVTMTIIVPWTSMGFEDDYLDYLTDEYIEAIGSQLESLLISSGLVEDDDYVEITTEYDDTAYTLVAVFDVQAMVEAEGYSSYDISLNSFVTYMEEDGFTCD